ncbi:MAG: PTS transporter subunit EIIC [Erysipelotrichaceae bacterium]|nr:PTS transporter subunit EIIC [Erysipelotrichaceae bacterium]
MAKNKYEDLANRVVDLVGGKENITYFTHCITRLRFNVKDKSLVNVEEIESIANVVGTNWSGEQLQIIIGQSVDDAYRLICQKHGFDSEEAIDENLDEVEKKKFKFSITAIFDGVAGCITPLIPVLIGCGMVKIILILMGFAELTDNSTYQVLTWVGDAGFYFLPVLVGYTAAKKFGANEALGMVIGAMLIYPTFVSGISAGESYNVFGIPIYSASYTSTIFPVILCVFVMAPIERFFGKISPEAVRSITEPLLTLLVMTPIAFCVLAPAGAFLGNYLADFILWLYNTTGFIGVAVLATFTPLLVMTGMHSAFTTYLLTMMSTVGYEPIYCTAQFISNINQGAASLAVGLKTKDKNLKSTGISCAVTAVIGGITEPAMYGINLKYRTPLYASMIGNLAGGLFAGLMKVYLYAFPGSSGVFGLIAFIGPSSMNIIYMAIAIIIGVVVTFAMTMVLYKEEA